MSETDLARFRDVYNIQSPVASPPRRVVSLVPSLTETLFDLQLGERVVAVTDYCIHPQAGLAPLPRVGGIKNPDIEKIVALQPDLVMMGREENRLGDAEQLRAAGIPIWVAHPQTVREALNMLWEIMYIFDEPAMVERVRWIERQLDWTEAVSRETAPRRVFVPIWHNPWLTCGAHTYTHDLLRVCGGENVFAAVGVAERPQPEDTTALPPAEQAAPYPQVTDEAILAAQPDVVLLPTEPYPFTEEHVQQIAALDIPAAHEGRIHLIDGTLLTWYGTRLAYALSEIPPLLAGI